ncbi:MAG: hypothetical protein E7676_03130 [Ruminococcaceae bacterium]|nr:hypothetical protein [Oscillospiraceae bacterium]
MKNRFEIIDFHSHILPGADHGSASLEISNKQLALAKESGVNRVISTSHFYPHVHTVDTFLEKRNNAYSALLPHIPKDMEIRLGAEVLICNGIENLPGLERLFVNGTNTLLLELSFSDFRSEYAESVSTMVKNGVNVVLAHADRYNPAFIEEMLACGAKIQLNAKALNTLFKRKVLYDWLSRGVVVALGSDIHGVDKTAYSSLLKAYGKIGKYAESVCRESAEIWNKSVKF